MKALYNGFRYYDFKEVFGAQHVALLNGPTVSYGAKELVIDPTFEEWEAAKDPVPVPIYNETDVKTLTPGMYLGLFHGRNDPSDNLDDWGFNGPVIGPLLYVHTTYGTHPKMRFVSDEVALRYGCEEAEVGPDELVESAENGSLMKYQGKYYGDWTIFIAPDCAL